MTGIVELLLVPIYLKRIHGPWRWGSPSFDPDDVAKAFPFLPDSEPIIVRLWPLMHHHDLASQTPIESAGGMGNATWWRWHAYAHTPFGWVQHPTPHFTDMRLTGLSLRPHYPESREERLDVITDYVESLIGPPDVSELQSYFKFRAKDDRPTRHRWKRSWGRVTCFLEDRDIAPVLSFGWGDPRPLSWS